MAQVNYSEIRATKAEKRKNSQWLAAFRRFKKKRLAVFGVGIVVFMIFVAILAPLLAPYPYDEQHLADSLLAPCIRYPFGTDIYGRCILSRVIYGARVSLVVGVVAVSMGAIVGCTLGIIAGYFGGVVDNVIMRIVDVILSIPSMLLAISISAMLGSGLFNAMVAISIHGIGTYARISKAAVLTVRDQEYVEAVRALSASHFRIIMKHIFPNMMAPLIVQFTLNIASSVMAASGLSFVGLGIQPPTAEWGSMLAAGREYIRFNYWLTAFPGLAIMLTIYGFNLMGDGLRDALDPRLKD